MSAQERQTTCGEGEGEYMGLHQRGGTGWTHKERKRGEMGNGEGSFGRMRAREVGGDWRSEIFRQQPWYVLIGIFWEKFVIKFITMREWPKGEKFVFMSIIFVDLFRLKAGGTQQKHNDNQHQTRLNSGERTMKTKLNPNYEIETALNNVPTQFKR